MGTSVLYKEKHFFSKWFVEEYAWFKKRCPTNTPLYTWTVNRKTQITTEIWKCQEIQHFDRKIPPGTTCEVMSYLRVKN